MTIIRKRPWLIILVLLACFVPSMGAASASDSVNTASVSLQSSPVYVESGTPGTDEDTSGYIEQFLTKDDHIVIVILNKSDMEPKAIATKILGSLREKSTIGLYVNGSAYAASNRIPTQAVNDALENAKAISMTPQETLATYVRQVHKYQAAHPEPVPTKSESGGKTTDSGNGFPFIPVFAIFGVLLCIAGLYLCMREAGSNDSSSSEQTQTANPATRQFDELSTKLRTDVNKIQATTPRNTMITMVDTLTDLLQMTGERNPDILKATADDLATQLNVMRTIVGGYLDEQEYTDLKGSQERMAGYAQAFNNFLAFAKERMNDLLDENYKSLQFQINRWRPQDDSDLMNALNLN